MKDGDEWYPCDSVDTCPRGMTCADCPQYNDQADAFLSAGDYGYEED